tara:strand:- start:121 stop:693 length:573 start_codon:yes stop_codon:yes gene_type:complete
MQLKVGDKVRFLNEAGEGIISAIKNDKEVMVEVDGFDYPYPASELLIIGENNEVVRVGKDVVDDSTPEDYLGEDSNRVGYFSELLMQRKNPKGVPEIDLHIQELIGDYSNLSHHEMRQLQLEHCRGALEIAMQQGVQRLVLIHGVGEGKLKQDVRSLIDGYQNLKWEDAPYKYYGYGATEVFVFQSQRKY